MIYLDNAATTLHKPPCVIEAVTAAMTSMGNSARGTYGSALNAARTIFETRERLAQLFGAGQPEHVCFTANSTEALNIAISGLFGVGDHVISTDLEHNSVLRPLYRLERQGGEVSFVKADREGQIRYEAFEELIRSNTKAIVCTHGSNLTGDLVDIHRVGEIAHAHHLLLVVDASQTAGVFPVTLSDADVICFTGHKSLMGPQGTGGLCFRSGVEIRPFKTGGTGIQTYNPEQPSEYPTRLEAGTLNGHGIAGLHASLGYIEETGMDVIRAHEQKLMRRFYDQVCSVQGLRICGNFDVPERAPIVSLNIGAYDSSEVSDELSERWGIATRPGAHCAPRLHRALGTEEQGLVRFSFSWFNTEEEVNIAAQAVRTLTEE